MEGKNVGKIIGDIGQWLAVFLLVIGALLIIDRQGVNGNVFIVCGSLFFGIFTKIKYYRRKR